MIEDMMKYLTDQERLMFQAELNGRRKAATTGVLLCFFLGRVGADRFYMGQKGFGIVYACFFWTTIPACIALVECFLMPRRVRKYNVAVAGEIAYKLKALRS